MKNPNNLSEPNDKLNVLYAEDDMQYRELLPDYLGKEDFEVVGCSSFEEARIHLTGETTFECAVLDMMLPRHTGIKKILDADVGLYGPKLARLAKENNPDCFVVGTSKRLEMTGGRQSFVDMFYSKTGVVDSYLRTLSHRIRNNFELARKFETNAFIVHGHNHDIIKDLQAWLQIHTIFDTTTVLSNSPGPGLPIIEKFEKYAHSADAVFVLLTRDDKAISNAEIEQVRIDTGDNESREVTLNKLKYRARQNVIFEAGYFFGKLGRSSGQVILLYEGGLELPTDMQGMIYVDITDGISAAHKELALELKEFVR